MQIYDYIIGFVGKLSKKAYYPFLLCLSLCLVGWILVYPIIFEVTYKTFFADIQVPADPNHKYNLFKEAWEVVTFKSKNLSHSLGHIDPDSWLSKKVFRLTIPLIMNVMHIPPVGIIAMQVLAGFLILLYCYRLSNRMMEDSISSTFFTAAVSFTYVGRSAYVDTYTWFDAFSYLLLILSIYFTRPLLVFLFAFLTAWIDERSFIALSIVFLFHQTRADLKSKNEHISIFKLNGKSLAVILAVTSYLLIRFYLQYKYGMRTPTGLVGLYVIKHTLSHLGIGVWTFLEGLWFIYLLSLAYLWMDGDWRMLAVISFPFFMFTAISASVYDTTRSGSFLFPIIFMSMSVILRKMTVPDMRKVLLICFLSCLTYPALYVKGNRTNNNESSIVKIIKAAYTAPLF